MWSALILKERNSIAAYVTMCLQVFPASSVILIIFIRLQFWSLLVIALSVVKTSLMLNLSVFIVNVNTKFRRKRSQNSLLLTLTHLLFCHKPIQFLSILRVSLNRLFCRCLPHLHRQFKVVAKPVQDVREPRRRILHQHLLSPNHLKPLSVNSLHHPLTINPRMLKLSNFLHKLNLYPPLPLHLRQPHIPDVNLHSTIESVFNEPFSIGLPHLFLPHCLMSW